MRTRENIGISKSRARDSEFFQGVDGRAERDTTTYPKNRPLQGSYVVCVTSYWDHICLYDVIQTSYSVTAPLFLSNDVQMTSLINKKLRLWPSRAAEWGRELKKLTLRGVVCRLWLYLFLLYCPPPRFSRVLKAKGYSFATNKES